MGAAELNDVVLADCTAYDVKVATVSKDKISLEWVEEDDPFCAALRSTNGVEYHGHFGCPQLNESWTMKMWRYLAEDGRVLLLTEWLQADEGLGGTCLFGLFPHVAARRDDDHRRTDKSRRISRTRPRRTQTVLTAPCFPALARVRGRWGGDPVFKEIIEPGRRYRDAEHLDEDEIAREV